MRKVILVCVLVMAGCMSEDVPYDDVASQESAVEETPAPDPETDETPVPGQGLEELPSLDQDDMRVVRNACESICAINAAICNDDCRRNAPVDWCYASCDPDICRGDCERKYPDIAAPPGADMQGGNQTDCCRGAYRACHRYFVRAAQSMGESGRDQEIMCLTGLSNCLLVPTPSGCSFSAGGL